MTTPATICFVEDSDLDFEIASRAVADVAPHASLVRAVDCHEAYEVVRSARPSMIVIDLNLPECSGIDLLRALRSQEGELGPFDIVVFSTSTNPTDRELAISEGANGYYVKPIDVHKYLDAVRSFVSLTAG